MCDDLSDRDDFPPPPRRPDLWRTAEPEGPPDGAESPEPGGDEPRTATERADGR